MIFPEVKQPKTVIRKIGGLLFDGEYNQIDLKKAESLLSMRTEVIVKPAQESGGGRDIAFYDTKADADELKKVLMDKEYSNYIIQDIVRQHNELAKMHPESLNTVRIYTLMLEDGVHVLSASLKMRAGGPQEKAAHWEASSNTWTQDFSRSTTWMSSQKMRKEGHFCIAMQ